MKPEPDSANRLFLAPFFLLAGSLSLAVTSAYWRDVTAFCFTQTSVHGQ